jgi:hypothetical protein
MPSATYRQDAARALILGPVQLRLVSDPVVAPSKGNCSQIAPPPAPADNPNASVLNNMATILGAQAGASITPGGGAVVFAGWVASVFPGSVWDYKKNLSGLAPHPSQRALQISW